MLYNNMSDKWFDIKWLKLEGDLIIALWQYKMYHQLRSVTLNGRPDDELHSWDLFYYETYHYSLGRVLKDKHLELFGYRIYCQMLSNLCEAGYITGEILDFTLPESVIKCLRHWSKRTLDFVTAGMDKTRIIVKFYSKVANKSFYQLFHVKDAAIVRAYPTTKEVGEEYEAVAYYY